MTSKRACRAALATLTFLYGLSLVGCATTTIRSHPEFQVRRAQISSVTVVPPEVEILRMVFKGDNETLWDEAESAKKPLAQLIEKRLSKRGFTVKDAKLEDETFEEDQDLRFQVTQINRDFARAMNEAYEEIEMRKSEAEKYERSLGPEVNFISDLAEVDALIFARMSGYKKSKGQASKDFFMQIAAGKGGPFGGSPNWATLQVALIDGTTGEILWANSLACPGEFTEDGMEDLVEGIFKEFPPSEVSGMDRFMWSLSAKPQSQRHCGGFF